VFCAFLSLAGRQFGFQLLEFLLFIANLLLQRIQLLPAAFFA